MPQKFHRAKGPAVNRQQIVNGIETLIFTHKQTISAFYVISGLSRLFLNCRAFGPDDVGCVFPALQAGLDKLLGRWPGKMVLLNLT